MMSLHWLSRCVGCGTLVGLLAATTSSCSDPAQTPAQGAFEATFSGAHCAAVDSPGPNTSIGTANPQAWATIADGLGGIHVSCKVTHADKLAVSFRISDGRTALDFGANLPTDNTSTTTTSVGLSGRSTAGGVYVPNAGTTCTAKLIEGAGGRAKGSFSCSETWNSVGSPDAKCAFAGYFIVENCGQ